MTDQRHEIARRFADARPGFTLLECEPVGLPYYWLEVDALTLERKGVPVLEEFVLEAVHAGLGTIDEIGAFLGVESPIVDQAAAAQYQTDALDAVPVAGQASRRLSLTPTGRQRRENLEMVTPGRTEITLAFDRLSWRFTDTPKHELRKPKDARDDGLLLVDPSRQRKPNVDELPLDELNRLFSRISRRHQPRADVLQVVRVLRGWAYYRDGHVLVFKPDDGAALEFMVVVDGRRSDAHTDAVNQLGGAKSLGIEPTAGTVSLEERPSLPAELEAKQVARGQVQHVHARLADATRRIDQATARVTEAEGTDDAYFREAYEQAQEEIRRLQAELDAIEVRGVETYEMRSLLDEALTSTRRRLLIIAPWITAAVVNATFLDNLEQRLRQGATVHIGLGIDNRSPKYQRDRQALDKLYGLAKRYEHMVVGWVGNTHGKVLISDERAVVGSFNWCSFKGDRTRTYRQEIGALVRLSGYADSNYQQRKQEIEAAAGKGTAGSPQPV